MHSAAGQGGAQVRRGAADVARGGEDGGGGGWNILLKHYFCLIL